MGIEGWCNEGTGYASRCPMACYENVQGKDGRYSYPDLRQPPLQPPETPGALPKRSDLRLHFLKVVCCRTSSVVCGLKLRPDVASGRGLQTGLRSRRCQSQPNTPFQFCFQSGIFYGERSHRVNHNSRATRVKQAEGNPMTSTSNWFDFLSSGAG